MINVHISDLLYRNFQTQLFEILLFYLVKTGCFVEYNACYILHFVGLTAIILRYTKNISLKKYAIANHKFSKEYSDVISIQIDPHLKKLLKNTKGSRFYETRCIAASGVRRKNEVNPRRARLVPGWVTTSSGRYTISLCNKPTRSTQSCIPPGSLNRVPASAGGKGGNAASVGWQVTLR